MTTVDDRARVAALLGRSPDGAFEVVRRDAAGDPVVIRNAPLLDDGRPMPTRYWLVGPREVLAVSRIEAAGGVRLAEAAVDPDDLRAAHERYAAERDAALGDLSADRPRPSGGVAGTRTGVKCLHAHYAWYLAGGDDPVGRWVADRLVAEVVIEIEPERVVLQHFADHTILPISPRQLVADHLDDRDPPHPADLTNSLGEAADTIDDAVRTQPMLSSATRLRLTGTESWHLACVERGLVDPTTPIRIDRDDLEDLFRTIATEPRADRAHNPALDPARVDTVVATCCVVLGVMRHLQFDAATFEAPS